MPGLVYSPINIVPKSNRLHCLVHDLSFPWNGHDAVNDCIPECNSNVHYKHIDNVIRMAQEMGSEIAGVRTNIAHAFRNLSIRLEDVSVLAFQ